MEVKSIYNSLEQRWGFEWATSNLNNNFQQHSMHPQSTPCSTNSSTEKFLSDTGLALFAVSNPEMSVCASDCRVNVLQNEVSVENDTG